MAAIHYDPIKQLLGTDRGSAVEHGDIEKAVVESAQPAVDALLAAEKPVLIADIETLLATVPGAAVLGPDIAAKINAWEIKL